MAKLLFSVIAPTVSAATQVAAPVTIVHPNYSGLTSAAATAGTTSTTSQLASSIGYTPDKQIVFSKFIDVLNDSFAATMASGQTSTISLQILWTKVQTLVSQTPPNIEHLLKLAPFSNIKDIYEQLINDQMAPAITTLNAYKDSNSDGPVDDYVQKIADAFNQGLNTNFNGYLPYAQDKYKLAVDDASLQAFVQSLVQSQVPFINNETDYPTIINNAATEILNDRILKDGTEVSDFQSKINLDFASVDAFKNEIAKRIIQFHIKYDEVAKSMRDEIDAELDINKKQIDMFGLSKLSTDYQTFYDQNIKIKFEGANSELSQKAEDLRSKLNAALNQPLGDVKTIVDEWKTKVRDAFVKQQKDTLDTKREALINQVQSDWSAILQKLPATSSFWDAYQVEQKFNKSTKTSANAFEAIWTLLGSNTAEITKFLKDYSSDTLVYDITKPDGNDSKAVVPKFFKAAINIVKDSTKPSGQKTLFNYDFKLSDSIVENEKDASKGFIPNYNTDTNVKVIYDYFHENYVVVGAEDLKNIILNDFKVNSNPTSEGNSWAVASPYSTLDLSTYFKGVDANGTHIEQNFFATPILTLDTTDDLAKLFPRINWLLTNDQENDFAFTLQDTLFGSNVANKANIFIDANNKPVTSVTNPSTQMSKFMNYDLKLSIKIGSNTTEFGANELIQANNVEVYDNQMDDQMVNALETYLQKTIDQKTKEDNSFVSFVVGEFWKWQNITDPQAKIPMTRSFDELYELLNLIFSNKGTTSDGKEASVPQVKLSEEDLKTLTPEQQEKKLNDLKIAQLDAISKIDYSAVNISNSQPLKTLFNLYPAATLLAHLRTSGNIALTQGANNSWKVEVQLVSQSTRFKDPNDSTYPTSVEQYAKESYASQKFEMAIHSLTKEIDEAIKEVSGAIDPYKPLFDKMVGRGDIEQTSLNDFIGVTVKGMVDKFKTDVAQKEIATDINNLKNLTLDNLKEAIVKWMSESSKNAKSQLDSLTAQLDIAQAALDKDPNYLPTISVDDNKKIIDSYKQLKTAEILSKLVGQGLPPIFQTNLADAQAKVNAFGIDSKLLDNVVDIESKINIISSPKLLTYKGVIATASELAAAQALRNNDNPYDASNISEVSDLAIDQIAEYLTSADLSDVSTFKALLDFIKNPLLAQKVELSTPMKAAIIALGSVMGLVGLGTTAATLTSVRTNKNLRNLGDEASIEYEKPWKIMIIKSLISVATLAAAAAIITLVFTLGGGI